MSYVALYPELEVREGSPLTEVTVEMGLDACVVEGIDTHTHTHTHTHQGNAS